MYSSEHPLVRLLIPFLTGVISGLFFPHLFWGVILFMGAGALMLIAIGVLHPFTRFRLQWVQGVILALFFFAAGMLRMNVAEQARQSGFHILGANRVLIRVKDFPQEREKTNRFTGKVLSYRKNGEWNIPEHPVLIRVYLRKEDPGQKGIAPGTLMIISGIVDSVPFRGNPGEFNYRKYLADNRVYGQVFPAGPQWSNVGVADKLTITDRAARIQHRIVEELERAGFSDRELAVASALMAGERNLIDPQTREIFAKSGAMHVLAISGLHVGILYFVLLYILGFAERIKYGRTIRALVILTLIWSYALITGLSPSVTRASIMFSFFLVGDMLQRRGEALNILAASALLMLVIHPWLIRSAGFLLSYMAVVAIILFYPHIRKMGATGCSFWNSVWSLIAVSIAAQAGTAPLSVYFFHQFPVLFPLTNLLVIPLVTLIIYVSLIWIVVLPVPVLSTLTGAALKSLVTLLLDVVVRVRQIPFSSLTGLYITPVMVVLLGLIIFSLFLFLIYRRSWFLITAEASILIWLGITIAGKYKPVDTLAVFNVPGHSVAGINSGGKTCVLDFSPGEIPPEMVTYVVKPFAERRQISFVHPGVEECIYSDAAGYSFPGWYYKGFLYLRGLKIFYFDSTRPILIRKINPKPFMDIMIFSGNRWWNLPRVLESVSVGQIVLDATVPSYASVQIKMMAEKYGISVYAVNFNGAFVRKITL